jgi:prepilin-type N-terminal cleavage/methylation domain-containing protein
MNRRGMTLIEMMVAVTATLILMGAIGQMFAVFGDAVTKSRSMLQVDAQLRVAGLRLRMDLDGATARTLPPLSPDSGEGYLEIIEGPDAENKLADLATVGPTDIDDVLLLTTRGNGQNFVGRSPAGSFESPVAEVAWFARQTVGSGSLPVTYTLYRRQLPIVGYAAVAPFDDGQNTAPFSSWREYYETCDVSARLEGSRLIPNTLADLTRPEARFRHQPQVGVSMGAFGTYPCFFVRTSLPSTSATGDVLPAESEGVIFDANSSRYGEDVVLRNVLAFDVRVFDPAAPIALSTTGQVGLVPGDPGFPTPPLPETPVAGISAGAYVDLGNNVLANSLLPSGIEPHFAGYGSGTGSSGLAGSPTTRRIYDTWSTHYESDGIDQDKTPPFGPGDGPDEGSNGVDDNSDGLADDSTEKEALPPYPYPLRGIEIRIRCWEPESRQVRQVTVRHTFVPH